MNVLKVAVTGNVHYTNEEIFTDHQVERSPICTKRRFRGYVLATEKAEVNCPKCLAQNV